MKEYIYMYILQKKYLCVVSDDINTIKKKSMFIARFHLKGKNMAEKYLDTQVREAMQIHRCSNNKLQSLFSRKHQKKRYVLILGTSSNFVKSYKKRWMSTLTPAVPLRTGKNFCYLKNLQEDFSKA